MALAIYFENVLACDTNQTVPPLSSSSCFFFSASEVPARHSPSLVSTSHCCMQRILLRWRTGFPSLSVHLRVHLTLSVLQPVRHCPVLYWCRQHLLILRSSCYLYVLLYPQKRFSAVGCLEIQLHSKENEQKDIFFCLLHGSKIFHLFLIFHCW